MFHKPFKVRSTTSIKGSDRKKLRVELGKQFGSYFATEQLSDVIPPKDDVTVTKIYSHSGEGFIIYSLDKNPIFFENIDKQLFPTVYTLWKYPDLLPLFATWPPVFGKMTKGADLMLPGVVVRGELTPSTLGNLCRGDICAINLVGNRSPVCVGITAMSSSDMFDSAMRGKGVKVLHTYTDQLWEMGDRSSPPILETSSPEAELNEEPQQSNNLSENCSTSDPHTEVNKEKDLGLSDTITVNSLQNYDLKKKSESLEHIAVSEADNPNGEQQEITMQGMDGLMYQSFLASLKTNVKVKDLPLLTSKFYRTHLQSCCPPGKIIDVKKSTYKKLSKFLKEMEKQDFVKVKELSKGVESIIEVNRNHPDLRKFAVPEDFLPFIQATSGLSADTDSKSTDCVPPEITELFGVPANMTQLFGPAGFSKGKALTAAEVRKVITDYVKDNQLQKEHSKGGVIMDAILTDTVLGKGERLDNLKWEELFKRCFGKMSPCHQVLFPGKPALLKKGRVECITINISQRGGNKKVTLVENLESFGIDPEEFGHFCQIGLACSTSISPLPGKGRGFQLLVQGSQTNFVTNTLTDKYKIDKKYILGSEKGPKGKKR